MKKTTKKSPAKKTTKKSPAKKTTKKSPAKKSVTGRGGARPGAGRKQMYGEPLSEAFTARVNEEQGRALGDWCRRYGVAPATLLREIGLYHAGAERLGLGIEEIRKSAEKEVVLNGASVFPVKCTTRQAAAIRRYCEAKKVAPGTWLREAALEYIGRAELGLRGQAAAMDRAL